MSITDITSSQPIAQDVLSSDSLVPQTESIRWAQALASARSFQALLIPQLEDAKKDIQDSNPQPVASQYMPLATQPFHWQQCAKVAQSLHESLCQFKLMSALYPTPLSLYNDPNHIDEEVLANGLRLEQPIERTSLRIQPELLADILTFD